MPPMQFCFINDIPSDEEDGGDEFGNGKQTKAEYLVDTPSHDHTAPPDFSGAAKNLNHGATTIGANTLHNGATSGEQCEPSRDQIDQSRDASRGQNTDSSRDESGDGESRDDDERSRDSDRESTPVATSVGECGCGLAEGDGELDDVPVRHRDIMKYFEPVSDE